MLDILHYLFEDDILSLSTAEQSEAQTKLRESLYASLYESTYKYGSTTKQGFDPADIGDPEDFDEPPVPIDPFAKSRAVIPYTPPTDFNPDAANPFSGVLDAPLR